jgi:TetR/AcrR family transcriptional regulator, cholesterol catabolism regulator
VDKSPGTRDRILGAAASLFREYGFNGTSMHDLAAEVGITKSSLYHHFPSKQALLSEILEATVSRVTPRIEAVVEADLPAVERLRQAVTIHVVELIADQDNVACFIEEGRYLSPEFVESYIPKRDRYENCLRQILQEGADSGELVTGDVRLAGLAILGMCNWVARWYRPDGTRTPDEIAAEFATLAVRAVEGDHDALRREQAEAVLA